ncbi:hypothetical protein HSX11_25390 [Oxalobacteraceae bacterium]|nr:hypothetical protein [Oxalobacteraceae bacterium]
MNTSFNIVVGDDYAHFANSNSGVLTASELLRQIDQPDRWSGADRVVLGQGMAEATRAELVAALRARQVGLVEDLDTLAPLQLTHKHHRENVLITEPRNITALCYQFNLVLNEINDRLSDHVTGQHVGAMLLMEAARQAVVASLECEYSRHSAVPLGFVLERFNSRFDNYVFPLPTAMTVTIVERSGKQDKNVAASLTIVFQQAGLQVCEMLMDVTLFETQVLDKIESRKARKSVDVLRAQLPAGVADADAAAVLAAA